MELLTNINNRWNKNVNISVHPVIFPGDLFAELSERHANVGAKSISKDIYSARWVNLSSWHCWPSINKSPCQFLLKHISSARKIPAQNPFYTRVFSQLRIKNHGHHCSGVDAPTRHACITASLVWAPPQQRPVRKQHVHPFRESRRWRRVVQMRRTECG